MLGGVRPEANSVRTSTMSDFLQPFLSRIRRREQSLRKSVHFIDDLSISIGSPHYDTEKLTSQPPPWTRHFGAGEKL